MKTLILTEKPSVAIDFARALGIRGKKDGFIEDDRHIITWAVGHLVELYEPDDYDPAWKHWNFENLPIIPAQFKYKPVAATRKQLNVITALLSRKAIDKIVIATDAGREGEVIARTILLTAGADTNDPVFRFWTSQALTPGVVKAALNNLKPGSDYDRLWHAGRSRQIADWLVGMNGSRAATIKLKDLFSIGRVQTAVLALIVDRHKERAAFVSEPFWQVKASFFNPKGTWQGLWVLDNQSRIPTAAAARDLIQRIENRTGVVTGVKKEKKQTAPPLLYSLTDLQRDANVRFGFSARQTLDIAQALYERKKCLSYPRTDSKVLGSQNVAMTAKLVEKLSGAYLEIFSGVDKALIRQSNHRVFNDARLTDHHALIPLAPIPGNTSDAEQKIYSLVLNRFAAAFYPDCRFEQTEIHTRVGDTDFFLSRGKVIIAAGWQKIPGITTRSPSKPEEEQENLPPLITGDPARVTGTRLLEKKTTPPPEYTEALLLKDMTNPGRYVQTADLKKIYRGDVGLGTQATRAQIIETLLARNYIVRAKKQLKALEKGILLIDTLRKFTVAGTLASPEKTARWELDLDQIARGNGSMDQFLTGIETFVRTIVKEFHQGHVPPAPETVIGKCPACGGEVVERFKNYGCANWKKADAPCDFVIWKTIAGKKISPRAAGFLLSGKVTGPFKGFISKKKKRFSAGLQLVHEQGRWQVRFVFDDVPSPAPNAPVDTPEASPPSSTKTDTGELGACPVCGAKIIEGNRGYGCSHWRKSDGGCNFVIWKTFKGKKLTPANIKALVTGKKTRACVFTTDDGQKIKARLKLEQKNDHTWEVVLVDG